MSKRGSPYLRHAIWKAATAAVQFVPVFRAYHEKKMAEGLCYMNSVGHVNRKMIAVIFFHPPGLSALYAGSAEHGMSDFSIQIKNGP